VLVTVKDGTDNTLEVVNIADLDPSAAVTMIQDAAERNTCTAKIDMTYIQQSARMDPVRMVLQTKGRSRRPGAVVGFLLAKYKDASTLYIDLVCSSKKGGGRVLMDAAVHFADTQGMDVALSAVPQVLGMYPKFRFEHRLSCEQGAEVVHPPAIIKRPALSANLYRDKTLLKHMMTLSNKGFTGTQDCNGQTFKQTARGRKDFILNECGKDGFYMMRCHDRLTPKL